MRISQAFKKLATNHLVGYDHTFDEWVDTRIRCILESSGRWISERVGFNARRVLLTDAAVTPDYYVVKIGDDSVDHIIYSEQRNVLHNKSYLFDYTLLDKTNDAQLVTISTVPSASGMGGEKTETLSASFPVHMVRFASTNSEEQDHVQFSRLYAFAPGNKVITEDRELAIDGDRYTITEAVKELLCVRLALVRR